MTCRGIAAIFGFLASILILWTLCSPRWSVSLPTTTSGQPINIIAYRGLWKQCYGQGGTAGDFNTQCNKYTLGIQELARAGIVGQRALVTLSFICTLFGFIAGIISTETVNVAKSVKTKSRSSGIAGILFFVGGFFTLASTTWATYNIVRNNVPIPPGMIPGGGGGKGIQMTLGSGIYVGWCGAATSIFVGILNFVGCCKSDNDEEDHEINFSPVPYQPVYATQPLPEGTIMVPTHYNNPNSNQYHPYNGRTHQYAHQSAQVMNLSRATPSAPEYV